MSTTSNPTLAQQVIRVLFIEDDEDDYILTRDLLEGIESARFEIDWVSDYQEGLERSCSNHYDVCLVDFRLGAHDGVELVREAISRGCHAPIIVLTGQGGREVDLAAMQAGAADFLNKSQITAPLLERSIRYSIQQRRAERQRIELVRAQTARREAEAANTAKDQFLATLSHELRTPLNAILGWTQLLRMPDLDEETRREAVDAIERNSKTQAQLIDDLLDMSRIISGKIRIHHTPVSLPQVVDAAIASVRPQIDEKKIHLVRRINTDIGLISGDPMRLQQVVWNLLTNAVKFTPEEGRIEVTLTREDGHALITVSDTGQGIAPQYLPIIFERFRQADSSTTRKQTGLGLGLAIVRHLVELHGGTIEATSEGLGRGATFSIRLPLTQPSGPVHCPADGEPNLVIDSQTLNGMRIVLVDDERDTRTVLEKTLRLHGAEVQAYEAAEPALTACINTRPNVLISDLAMPGEDGFSLVRRLRQAETTPASRCLAIALSAYTSEQDRQNALAAGFDTHLPKPIDPVDLIAAVARLASTQATG